jgi:hypothetical protein
MVVNRYLEFAEYGTDSEARKHTNPSRTWSAKEVNTQRSGTLDADAQLSHVIFNGTSAAADDFFFSIEIPGQRILGGKASLGKTVRAVG